MSLTTTLTLGLTATLTNALDLSTARDALSYSHTDSLDSGTAIDQADKCWHDQRTLAASATENLDLAGSLTDALGVTFTLARVKTILIRNRSTTAGNNLVVGGAASNAWEGWTTVTGAKVNVGPDGVFFKHEPSAAGMAVTAGTADQLKIENAGSGSITYDIIVIGASA